MKKIVRKLTLNRETLRRLDEAQLQGAVGALPFSRQNTCGIACTAYNCKAELKQHVDNPGQTPM